MERTRIFITGIGAVTPLGIGVDSFWNALTAGKCGIAELEGMEEEIMPVRRAGQVKDFDPKAYLSVKLAQDLEPYAQYAYVAAEEAVAMSGLNTESDRVGIVMGSALSGINMIGETNIKYKTGGRQAGPKFLTKAMGNIAAAYFSIKIGRAHV